MVFIRLFFATFRAVLLSVFKLFTCLSLQKSRLQLRNCHQPSHAHAFQNYLYARAHASVLDSLSKYLSSVGRHVVNGS